MCFWIWARVAEEAIQATPLAMFAADAIGIKYPADNKGTIISSAVAIFKQMDDRNRYLFECLSKLDPNLLTNRIEPKFPIPSFKIQFKLAAIIPLAAAADVALSPTSKH